MKKQVLFSFIVVLNATFLSAQLKVSENGNVGIKNSSENFLSALSINSPGNEDYMFDIEAAGSPTGFHMQRTEAPSWGGWTPAIHSTSYTSGGSIAFGTLSYAWGDTPAYSGKSIGVCGIAANSTDGYNFGVVGSIKNTQDGTGIFGSDDHRYLAEFIDGRYAGYFYGNVKVTGTLNGTVVGNSDIRYKQNIIGLDELFSIGLMNVATDHGSNTPNSILTTVLALNPVQYNYKQVYFESANDTTTVTRGFFNEDSQMFQKKHYGLIAQELQAIYPELVYEEDNGYLAIDYIGLIPILIQSIKELNAKVDALENAGSALTKRAQMSATDTGVDETAFAEKPAVLYQNTPNPFSQATTIKYYLPESTTTASLCIYDMQGKQLKQITLSQRGEGAELISASQLAPGMYLYVLIADGQEVDIKRMILTE